MTIRSVGVLLLLLTLISVGCQNSSHEQSAIPSAEVLAVRTQYLLDEQPTDAIGVKVAKETIEDEAEVVLTGTIDAGEREPWEAGKALFLLTETNIGDHGHSGDGHDNCPFCNREKANNLALIRFVDDAGETVEIDARELFGLEKGQQVVVTGTGNVDPSGTLVVTAKGIYLES